MSGFENFNIPNKEHAESVVTREQLISFAGEKPPRDPEVEVLLKKWLEQTGVPEDIEEQQKLEEWEYADITVMHTTMKYRLGFITTEEVILELEQVREGLVAREDEISKTMLERLENLMYAIEDGVFEVVHPA